MKKPAVTLLALVLLLVAGIAGWLVLEQSGRGSARGQAAAATPARAEKEETALAQPKPAVELAPVDAPPKAPALAVPTKVEDERRAPDSGSGRRIRGHVFVPANAPPDDSLRVVALKENLAPKKVYGTGGVLDDLADGKRESALGTAPVAPDGTFTLALATADDTWLALDGRFLYSNQVKSAPAGTDSVELAAELGGALAGQARMPAGTPASALDKVDAELGPDGEDFSMSGMAGAPLFPRRAKIDAEGRFELRALPPAIPHALEVRPVELADTKVGGLKFEAGIARNVEVVLLRGATLAGTVRDESGKPVADADVVAAESAIWGFPGEELAKTKSDSSGAFAIEHIAPGKCLLIAKKEGALDSEGQKLELRDEERRERLELVLSRGALISGTVHQPGSTPAAGTEVQVNFDPEALVGMNAFNAARGGSGKAKCGDDGRFEVTGLGKGPFVVVATLERKAADGKEEKWKAKADHVKPDTRDIELTLAAPSVVKGRVMDSAGKAIAKFHLRATIPAASVFLPGETHEQDCNDPEGDFVLRDLDAGHWKVDATADGFGPMEPVELTLPRSDDTALELVLAPAASIAGHVLEPGGGAAVGAKVTLQPDNAQRMQRVRGELKAPEALTDEHGDFVLTNLAGGTISIYAESSGFAPSEPVSVETKSGEQVEGVGLKLRRGAVVTGEAYGKDGKPASGARIVAQEQGNWSTNLKRADGEGHFRFEALVPGNWTVGSSRVDLQACKLEYSIVSPK